MGGAGDSNAFLLFLLLHALLSSPAHAFLNAVVVHRGGKLWIQRAAVPTPFPSWDKCVESVGVDKKLVVVDFYATWCGPCDDMGVIIENLATEMDDLVGFVKVDTDKHVGVASRYQIEGFPTLCFFQDGKTVDRIVGMVSKDEITAKIKLLCA